MPKLEYIHVSTSAIEGGSGGERVVPAGGTMLIAEWMPLDVGAIQQLELILYPAFGDDVANIPANVPRVLSWWMNYTHGLVEHRIPLQPVDKTAIAEAVFDSNPMPTNGVVWRFAARRARVFVRNLHDKPVQFVCSLWETAGGPREAFPVDVAPHMPIGPEGSWTETVWRRFPVGAREWKIAQTPYAGGYNEIKLKAANGSLLLSAFASELEEWRAIPAEACFWGGEYKTAVYR